MPKVILSPEIATRDEFGWLLQRRALWGVAVEVGVNRGAFGRRLLDTWGGRLYFGIDPYQWDGTPTGRAVDQQFAVSVLTPHAHRVILVPKPNDAEQADGICRTEGAPCFVYIDGDHHYRRTVGGVESGVALDLEIWWPRLAEAGILAGHDYTPHLPDVPRAVNELAVREGLTVYVTHDAAYKSWYIYKNQKIKPIQRYESMEIKPVTIPRKAAT